LTFVIGLVVGACVGSAKPVLAPKASEAALATKAIPWEKRDQRTPLVPASVKQLQLIITPGWDKDEHVAWLIADGTDVIAAYQSRGNELGEVVDTVTKIYVASASPANKMSFVMMGSYTPRPPPPPPGPGGMPQIFPQIYVEEVMRAAWNVNHEAARVNATAIGE
jgi:hypothetical protein